MTRGEGRRDQDKGAFGTVSQLPSGRWRAMYYGPDGTRGRRYKADTTFVTKKEARKFLATVQTDQIRGKWMPPADPDAAALEAKTLTLKSYAGTWLPKRKVRGKKLKPRTQEHYTALLDQHILPTLGNLPLASITRDDVEKWYDHLDDDTPTQNAHSYSLLKTILGSAVTDRKITTNPCVIRGAGQVQRAVKIRPATIDELAKLVDAMEPPQYKAMILLAAWCALRFGELTELRRKDVDVDEASIRIWRGVVRTADGFTVGDPKSVAGFRDVAIPPHLLLAIKAHLVEHTAPGADALLFPAKHGGHLATSTLYRRYYTARDAAGRSDLRFHDLRHTGAVLAAATGATLAELMARLGHSTPAAALRYQHAAEGADQRIASALSEMVIGPRLKDAVEGSSK